MVDLELAQAELVQHLVYLVPQIVLSLVLFQTPDPKWILSLPFAGLAYHIPGHYWLSVVRKAAEPRKGMEFAQL